MGAKARTFQPAPPAVLEDSSIEGARGIIVNITGGADLSLAKREER